ncbi:MAG TPA: sulfotransferase domain-containing protein [Gemmatimonadota bacterium]|nr:sulfotransferase domain-containing protein [Gemmatimonadota bacterium]
MSGNDAVTVRRTPIQVISSKVEQAWRLASLRYLSAFIPIFLVTEYPRSGGTWLSQMLADCLDLPFPRNRIPLPRESLFHGHYPPSRTFRRLPCIFWLVRDGRDVMVSLYHHYLLWNEKNRKWPADILYHRKMLRFEDYEDVRGNLAAFMEFSFTHTPSPLVKFTHPGNWASFNGSWLNQQIIPADKLVNVRYEELLNDTATELTRVLTAAAGEPPNPAAVAEVVGKYSFDAQAGRRRGEEDSSSFLRKGVAGDWRNYFSAEAAQTFDRHAGDILIRLGYEDDRSWVKQVAGS